MIAAERLRELFHYDPETGIFKRRVKLSNAAKLGVPVGSTDSRGYIQFWADGKMSLGHRMAWLYVYGELPPLQIDHINGDREDNRICNLRLATSGQNKANAKRRVDNKSGIKGVDYDAQYKKWRAQICTNGQRRFLGRFDKKEDAARAYAKAATEAFGEFARLA